MRQPFINDFKIQDLKTLAKAAGELKMKELELLKAYKISKKEELLTELAFVRSDIAFCEDGMNRINTLKYTR